MSKEKQEELIQEEEDVISEGAEYSPKSEFSKARSTYDALDKCIVARGKEMISGFWNMKVTKQGSPIRIWQEDSRKVYLGCVQALKNLLYPERQRSENMKEFEKEFEKSKGKLWDKYCYTERVRKIIEGQRVWVFTKNKYMPSVGALVVVNATSREAAGRKIAEEANGGWDGFVNSYYDEMVILYDSLFERLNGLIDSLNYFKPEVSY